jgi:hypothetical protein
MGKNGLCRSGSKSLSSEINLRKGSAIKKKGQQWMLSFFCFGGSASASFVFCGILEAGIDIWSNSL